MVAVTRDLKDLVEEKHFYFWVLEKKKAKTLKLPCQESERQQDLI